jgi:peptidyl-prolyl cis-trans isomerase SurA
MNKPLAILLAALLLGPTANPQSRTVDRIVAQVNDDIITLSDLNREMAEVRQELATKYAGDQLEQETKKAEKMVLDDLIRQRLLLQKASELGFGANVDLQVTATIENIRKQNNIKDMQEFERALAQQGMTMVGFRERLRRQIVTQSLVQEFVGSRITLLSQEIDKYYKDHAPEYTSQEEVTLSEIMIPFEANPAEAETKANEIHASLRQGEAFAALASQYSKGPTASKGGGIGTYLTAKLNPAITGAIANLKEGEFTGVQKGADSFIIYRVDARKPAVVRPLEEVRDEIRNRLWEQKFNPEFERFVSQLKDEAYIQIFAETKEP